MEGKTQIYSCLFTSRRTVVNGKPVLFHKLGNLEVSVHYLREHMQTVKELKRKMNLIFHGNWERKAYEQGLHLDFPL